MLLSLYACGSEGPAKFKKNEVSPGHSGLVMDEVSEGTQSDVSEPVAPADQSEVMNCRWSCPTLRDLISYVRRFSPRTDVFKQMDQEISRLEAERVKTLADQTEREQSGKKQLKTTQQKLDRLSKEVQKFKLWQEIWIEIFPSKEKS